MWKTQCTPWQNTRIDKSRCCSSHSALMGKPASLLSCVTFQTLLLSPLAWVMYCSGPIPPPSPVPAPTFLFTWVAQRRCLWSLSLSLHMTFYTVPFSMLTCLWILFQSNCVFGLISVQFALNWQLNRLSLNCPFLFKFFFKAYKKEFSQVDRDSRLPFKAFSHGVSKLSTMHCSFPVMFHLLFLLFLSVVLMLESLDI